MNSRQSKPRRRKSGPAPREHYLRVPPPADRPDLPAVLMRDIDAVRVTRGSLRSVYRWRRDGIPAGPVLEALQAAAYRLLPHDAWRGWWIDDDGRLCRDGLRPFTVQQLHHVALAFDQAAALRLQVARLQARLDALTAAPPPIDAPAAANDAPGQLRLFARAKENPRQLPAGGSPLPVTAG